MLALIGWKRCWIASSRTAERAATSCGGQLSSMGRLDKHAGEAVGGLGCLEDIRTCDDELLGTALVGSEGPFKT